MRRTAVVALLVWIAGIVLANWLITRVGIVTVWPWPRLAAPAGVYAAGVTFTCRDVVQEGLGRWWAVVAIAAGALLSAVLSPSLALASGVAFTVGEAADWMVYEPLRRRQWGVAVLASGLVGAVVDSWLFLELAHLPAARLLAGNVVGKVWVVAAAALLLQVSGLRRRIAPAAV